MVPSAPISFVNLGGPAFSRFIILPECIVASLFRPFDHRLRKCGTVLRWEFAGDALNELQDVLGPEETWRRVSGGVLRWYSTTRVSIRYYRTTRRVRLHYDGVVEERADVIAARAARAAILAAPPPVGLPTRDAHIEASTTTDMVNVLH